ncbi:MAG: hypothetical protein KBD01_02750 [Acidobacteria bacterium]|nr:hypothetical protein [Acidobacteriota bacterium]
MSAENLKHAAEAARHTAVRRTVSEVLPDGTLVELLYRPAERRTLFLVWQEGQVRYEDSLLVDDRRLLPYSPENNLLRNDVVLFPSDTAEYGAEQDLVAEIQRFVHRYVDVSALFEKLASYYVLFTWVYDAFNELPYLRLLGDPGSGKTRFLLTVGSLCYKPIFASGASTVSPLFRILDAVRGTLIVDEGDFRLSDERAEIVKILNNGNGRGFPVLRTEVSSTREFNPTAYAVFGPKLVATRGLFEDRALESRCLTEVMGQRRLRADVPINLPNEHKDAALALRNKLLLFRLRTLGRTSSPEGLVDPSLEPRLNQVLVPLLSVIHDERTRTELRDLARRFNRELVSDRALTAEAQVLEVIRDLLAAESPLSVKEVTGLFTDRHGEEYERKVTPKWVGFLLRNRLHLRTEKRHGAFVVPNSERPALERLFERYGIEPVTATDAAPPALVA